MSRPEGTAGHPGDGELLAWLDGEVLPARRTELQRHVDGCHPCSLRLRELRASAETLSGALRATDVAPPRPSTGALRRRASRPRLPASIAAAAVLVLLFAGGVLALVPGSPLRSWLEGLRRGPSDSTALPVFPASVATRLSVISPDSVDVVVGLPIDSLRLELVRSAGHRLVVATDRPAKLGRLELGSARLRVDPGSARSLRIAFPRSARVRVLLNGRDVLASPGRSPPPERGDSVLVSWVTPAHGQETP